MSAPRWEWDGTPEADHVQEWMRLGETRNGAMHAILRFLAVNLHAAEGLPEGAERRPFQEIVGEALACRSDFIAEAPALLARLEQQELVERWPGDEWSIKPHVAEWIDAAYADRHPSKTPAPWDDSDDGDPAPGCVRP